MTHRIKTRIALAAALALPFSSLSLVLAGPSAAQTPQAVLAPAVSSALCARGDVKEPGLQGEVPAGQTAAYNCGVKLLGQLPRVGSVQGSGKCAYVRSGGNREGSTVYVIDVSNPAKPVEVGNFPVKSASETMRVVVNAERAILVSGSSVYDIRDCLKPVLLGEIKWPAIALGMMPPMGGGGGTGILPHDLRINPAGTKVYGSLSLWEADITNLRDPSTWKVTDHRCALAVQVAGPWQGVHREADRIGMNLCEDQARPGPYGANNRIASSGIQAALLWPLISHGIGVSGDNKRVYLGEQAGGPIGLITRGHVALRVFDVSQTPIKLLGETFGAGHSVDWFRVGGREYVLHANEGGSGGIGQGVGGASGSAGDPCRPHPRPEALGWAFDAYVSDVTDGANPRNVSRLTIAINEPENCAARKASGKDPSVAYHLIDDPMNAKFAAVNFGAAGLRIYDIRQPDKPAEVAYFNHGPLVHGGVGHYDAARGLIYAAGSTGLWILQIEPQVRQRLRL